MNLNTKKLFLSLLVTSQLLLSSSLTPYVSEVQASSREFTNTEKGEIFDGYLKKLMQYADFEDLLERSTWGSTDGRG